jgi:hypothetical protein
LRRPLARPRQRRIGEAPPLPLTLERKRIHLRFGFGLPWVRGGLRARRTGGRTRQDRATNRGFRTGRRSVGRCRTLGRWTRLHGTRCREIDQGTRGIAGWPSEVDKGHHEGLGCREDQRQFGPRPEEQPDEEQGMDQ